MYSRPVLAVKYLDYLLNSSNGKGHGTHSPFVFEFITKILRDKKEYESYSKVESLRTEMLHDQHLLTVEDMGAGSGTLINKQRSISSIAKHSLKSKKWGQLLYRIIAFYQPATILELGTSLGITTSYFALALPDKSRSNSLDQPTRIITLEGASDIADIARKNFQKLSLKNIELIEGNFDDTLQSALGKLSKIDFAFIDGNHRREPTEKYFAQILPKTHNESILVFDDIHWSREMETAWKSIRDHPSARCSIDLFSIGLVFFREEFREKQHFRIRF